MATMDEYTDQQLADVIGQLLAEMQMPEPVQSVVHNILDEPISEAVKERLLKPLLPRKYRALPPPRKVKERKRKAIEEEFDPVPTFKTFPTIHDDQKEILDLFNEASKNEKTDKLVFRQTPWVIGKFLRGWQMNAPQGHLFSADPRAFLDDVRPQIYKKLTEEVVAFRGVKFQLALKVQLRKGNPDGSEEYTRL